MRSVGIYGIRCRVTGKVYVGSSLNCTTRCKDHVRLLRLGKHGNRYLQSAWNKYGAESFDLVVLEVCATENELRAREKWWIDHLRTAESRYGFNCQYPVKDRTPSVRMTKVHKAYWSGLSEEEKRLRTAHFGTTKFQKLATAGKQSEQHKELKRRRAKEQWLEPEMQAQREVLRERMKRLHTDPSTLAKISAKAKERWKGKNYRNRGLKQIGEASKLAAEILRADPVKYQERLDLLAAQRAKAAAAIKARWQDPEFRARRIAQMRLPRQRKPRSPKEE